MRYRACADSIADYYLQQAGKGANFYYQGAPLQRGYGLGSIFSALFRSAVPLIKNGANAEGLQLMRSGADFANDLVQGIDLKTAARQRAREAGRSLTDKAATKLRSMLGGKNKRKRPVKKAVSRKRSRKVITPDIFNGLDTRKFPRVS